MEGAPEHSENFERNCVTALLVQIGIMSGNTRYRGRLARKEVGRLLIVFKETVCSISVAANDHQGICDFSGTGKLKGSEIFRLVEGKFQALVIFGGLAEDSGDDAEAEPLYVVHRDHSVLFKGGSSRSLKRENQSEIPNRRARKHVSVAFSTIPFQASAKLFPV